MFEKSVRIRHAPFGSGNILPLWHVDARAGTCWAIECTVAFLRLLNAVVVVAPCELLEHAHEVPFMNDPHPLAMMLLKV